MAGTYVLSYFIITFVYITALMLFQNTNCFSFAGYIIFLLHARDDYIFAVTE
jgi:hypothetical protein